LVFDNLALRLSKCTLKHYFAFLNNVYPWISIIPLCAFCSFELFSICQRSCGRFGRWGKLPRVFLRGYRVSGSNTR